MMSRSQPPAGNGARSRRERPVKHSLAYGSSGGVSVSGARTAISLIFSGVLRQRPNIRVILSHGGGALPILVSRIAMVSQTPLVSPRPDGGADEVLEEVRRPYFDLALSATPLTLNALLQITSLSHILFGTDYPFAAQSAIEGNTAGFDKLMDSLPPAQRKMVEYENAAELFLRLKAFLERT